MAEGPNPVAGISTTLYCPTCGSPTPADAQMCARCGTMLTPMTMRSVPPVPPEVPSPITYVPPMAQVEYAGFWLRVVAAILDGILVQVVIMPVGFVLGAVVGVAGGAVRMPAGGTEIVAMIGGAALAVVASWLYGAGMESSTKQATLGKMLLGIKVTDESGERISFARASGRHFGKYLSSLILGIGYIMAGVTAKKQALHDMLAGTLVVRK